MSVERHVAIVFLFDQVDTSPGQFGPAPNVGDIRARVLRWVQLGSIPATFAVASPNQHPWTESIRQTAHGELGLLVDTRHRGSCRQAAERFEAARAAGCEPTCAVAVGDRPSSTRRKTVGLDIWAHWNPARDLVIPMPPWRDRAGWQFALRAWSEPRGGRSATGWWRSHQANWSVLLPPPGRRHAWVLPVMSYSTAQLQACDNFLKQLASWSRQGLVTIQTLSVAAESMQHQSTVAPQRSILSVA